MTGEFLLADPVYVRVSIRYRGDGVWEAKVTPRTFQEYGIAHRGRSPEDCVLGAMKSAARNKMTGVSSPDNKRYFRNPWWGRVSQ